MPKVKKVKKARGEEGWTRRQYQDIGLTYSRCDLDKKFVEEYLLAHKWEIGDYYICQEIHKENDAKIPTHLHIWFHLVEKQSISHCRWFDIKMPNGKVWHPNIGNKKRNWIWNYLKKYDKNPVTNIEEGYIAKAKAGKYDEAMEQFAHQHPKEFAINYIRISRNFRSMSKKKREEHVYSFTGEVYEWDMKQKSLVIIGAAGLGKTEWAKSFVVHHLKKTYLRITHIDKLKEYDGEDVLIFDDVSFQHLPRETQIHMCEVRNGRDIHCRNRCATIPPGIINIFLANNWPFIHEDPSIDRRCEIAPGLRFY